MLPDLKANASASVKGYNNALTHSNLPKTNQNVLHEAAALASYLSGQLPPYYDLVASQISASQQLADFNHHGSKRTNTEPGEKPNADQKSPHFLPMPNPSPTVSPAKAKKQQNSSKVTLPSKPPMPQG